MRVLNRLWYLRTLILFGAIVSCVSIAQTAADIATGVKTVHDAAVGGPLNMLALCVVVLGAYVWWKDSRIMRTWEKSVRNQAEAVAAQQRATDVLHELVKVWSGRRCVASVQPDFDPHRTPNPVADAMAKLDRFPTNNGPETPV